MGPMPLLETPPAGAPPTADLHTAVIGWYDDNARELPWRHPDRTPWGVLISEVMLQQTPVARVEPVWQEWMARWPTPADLAAAPTADVIRAWGRLGYPRRALRLRESAQAIVAEHGGQVPADPISLRALPGIGEYTAAAVVSFAFGRRAVVADTNIRRALARAVDGRALPAPTYSAVERSRLDSLTPADDDAAARWSVAVMELGALVCTATDPACGRCPLADRCAWRAAGHPPDADAHRRRSQPWAGTDRQCRGTILAALREAPGPLATAAFAARWPDATHWTAA